jgi:hypothetical protein
MSYEDITREQEGLENSTEQTELEKLLKQKQLETEALKRLIDLLGKSEQAAGDLVEPEKRTNEKYHQ